MRWLIGLVTAAVFAWGGWWYLAATGAERAARAGISVVQAQGHRLDIAGLAVSGFPNRIDLTLTDPVFERAGGGLGWQAEFLQIFSLSYKPWHVIATVAPEQRLTTGLGEVLLQSPRMRASVIARPSASLPLDRFALDAEPLTIRQGTTELRFDRLTLAGRATPALPDSQDIGLRIEGLGLPQAPPGLPQTLDSLLIETQVGFTAPIDRFLLDRRPAPTVLDLRNLDLRWGILRLQGDGQLRPDAQGRAEGTITLRIANWRALMPVLTGSGLITPEFAPNVETALALMARPSEDGTDQLVLPLRLQRGAMTLGPLPLGPAPTFPRW